MNDTHTQGFFVLTEFRGIQVNFKSVVAQVQDKFVLVEMTLHADFNHRCGFRICVYLKAAAMPFSTNMENMEKG